jgi:PAS domain S-box-containing protein
VITQGQQELAQARDRAETLYQIGRALAGTLDEREVLSQALPLLAMATGAESGAILLSDPISGRLMPRTTFDRLGNSVGARVERGRELSGLAMANRRPMVVADTWQDTVWRGQPGRDEGVRSVLAAPLLLEDQPRGTILLTHPDQDHFRDEHGQLVLAAGNQIAVAMAKAQLYRYVTEQSEQLSVTLQQREEEISKSQAILRSIGDGVVVSDRLGRIRMINPAAEKMIGVNAEEYQGRLTTDLPGAHELPTSGNGVVERVQLKARTLHANYAPVLSPSGDSLGSVIVFHDITREAMTDRLKSEFIATASHELRTPLTSIRGYVDLLLIGTFGQLTQAQIDFLKIVKNNVVRLVDLIDDLLDMSKVEAGEVRLRREDLNLSEIAYDVCETLYTQFTERSISLAIDAAEDLPTIVADRQRVRQIILNLVSNACKYTHNGGHVDLVLSNDDRNVRVDVRDTGVGIPEEAKPFIFTPFFRADNPLRESAGGTGLGLSITKTLIDLHGGQIWFDANEAGGTTFSFTLPIRQEEWQPAEWLAEKA